MSPPEKQSNDKGPTTVSVGNRAISRLAWLALGLALGCAAWILLASGMPLSPFALIRDSADGLATTNRSDASSNTLVSFEGAKIDAKNSVSSMFTAQHFENSAFSCRHVVILNDSDHPLLEHIGNTLPDQLTALSFVDHVDYFPAGTSPPVGSRSADLWITLDLGRIKTSGMLPRFSLDAAVKATAGTTLAAGSYSIVNSTTPPIAGICWQGTVNHTSKTTGISSDKFKLAAQNITDQLVQALIKQLQPQHDKHGPLPILNDAFYPAYTPTPEELTFDGWDARQVLSTHGLMFSNETFWRVATTEPISAKLAKFKDRFVMGGWKVQHFNEAEQQPHLSLARDAESLNIFLLRGNQELGHTVTIRVVGEQTTPEAVSQDVYVHYVHRLNRAALAAAVDQQLDQGGPLDSLLLLSSKLSSHQRARYIALLEQEHTRSSQAWRTLANAYSKSKQQDKARAALRRAHWLAKLDPGSKGLIDNSLTKLAKQLDAEEILTELPSPALFRELGITELRGGESMAPVEIGLNQPASFFATDEKGDWHALNWRIQATGRDAPGQRYEVGQAHVSQRTSSWGSGQLLPTGGAKREVQTISGLGKVIVEIEELADQRFRFVAKLEPK